MADIKSVLTEEIRRLARKEVKTAVEPLYAKIVELKKTVSLLSKELNLSKKGIAKTKSTDVANCEKSQRTKKAFRFNAESIKKLRAKLNLSQVNFAKLVGVSMLTVSCWELGKNSPRAAAKAKLATLRHIGKHAFETLCKEKNITF